MGKTKEVEGGRLRFTLLVTMLLTCRMTFAAEEQSPAAAGSQADRRPTKIWNRTGLLGETPKQVTDAYPLSDQQNQDGWVKFDPMSDEFEGDGLDLDKWILGIAPWKGRQPALFSDDNVCVSDGRLHLTMRKEPVPAPFEKLGYKDYTSAALHTKAKTAYGYFETKAKPMNSDGSSSFWFKRDAPPGWSRRSMYSRSAGRQRDSSSSTT